MAPAAGFGALVPLCYKTLSAVVAPRHARPQAPARAATYSLGTANNIAYGMLYLASGESAYVTSAELVIDGGTRAQ